NGIEGQPPPPDPQPLVPPAAISTPRLYITAAPGTMHVASGGSTSATIADLPAAATAVVFINAQSGGTVNGLSDTAGNNYTQAIQQTGVHDCELWYKANCTAMLAGGTFSATTVGGGTYTISGAV